MKTPSLLLASLALALSASFANAQTFTSGAFALDGSNLETAGPVFTAISFYRFDSTPITINGVTFTEVLGQNPDGSSVDPQTGPHFSFDGGGTDGTGGGLTGASAAVAQLNQEGEYYGSTFTLTGLTVGQEYAAQFIFDANNSDNRSVYLTDGSATSDTVTGGIPGPQFITDTFTATTSTESIGRAGGVLQVSGLVVEAIPEPSTWALMGLSLAGLLVLAPRSLVRS